MAIEHTPVGAGSGSHPPLDAMIDLVVEAFEVAARHKNYGPRLSQAETTTAVDFGPRGITLLLDRSPIEVVEGLQDGTDSRIWGTEEQWLPVFVGGNLGIALARGELQWSGSVRRFLRVFPIFRFVYASLARDGVVTSMEERAQ